MSSGRKHHRRLHLWLGLSVGVLFFIISLSGSVLVFYDELDQMINLDAEEIQKHRSASPDFDTALLTLRQAYPSKVGSWRLEVTEDASVIPARYYNPPETAGEDFAPMMVWLTSDGKVILRKDFWGHYLMTWIYNLHFRLLMGESGGVVVGYLGLVSLYLLISGLVSWWPKKGQWQKKLRFKKRSSLIGLLYDWHKLIGLVFTVPLLLLTLTGVMLALPQETRWLLEPVSGPSQSPMPPANSIGSDEHTAMISPTQALASVQNAISQSRAAWIETPSATGSPFYYRIRVQTTEDPSRRFPHSYIYIDSATAKILRTFSYEEQGMTNTIMNWLHPIHDGTLFLLVGRIFWVVSGLSVAILFITGVARWYYRRRGRPTKLV